MVEQLRKDRIDVIVVDPISAVTAACGIDENGNAEVRPLLDRFDAAAREAGCRGIVIVHHTGHDGSRFRGASAFGDWATAVWTLQRDGDGPSRLSAKGRDVHVVKSTLVYDDQTRLLSAQVASADQDGVYFWGKRGTQLTAAVVSEDLNVSKPTATKRLHAAEGWEIVQAWQGSSPDLWEYSGSGPELGDYDPWSSSSSGSPF